MLSQPIGSLRDTGKIATAPPQTSVADAAALMLAHGVGAVVVVDEGTLAGIFTEHDIVYRVIAPGLDARAVRIGEVMTREPLDDRPGVDARPGARPHARARHPSPAGGPRRQARRHGLRARRARPGARGLRLRGAPTRKLSLGRGPGVPLHAGFSMSSDPSALIWLKRPAARCPTLHRRRRVAVVRRPIRSRCLA